MDTGYAVDVAKWVHQINISLGTAGMKISLEDDDFKQVYLQGKLAIDCLEITLTQNCADKPRIYKLVGSLLVNADMDSLESKSRNVTSRWTL